MIKNVRKLRADLTRMRCPLLRVGITETWLYQQAMEPPALKVGKPRTDSSESHGEVSLISIYMIVYYLINLTRTFTNRIPATSGGQ